MNSALQNARREYEEYFVNTVFPVLGLTEEAVNELGFYEIAQRIHNSLIKQKYRSLAIELLEENLRGHQAERPRAVELFEAKHIYELREWQKISNEWEESLWALVSQQ